MQMTTVPSNNMATVNPYYKVSTLQGIGIMISLYCIPIVFWLLGIILYSSLCLMITLLFILFGLIPIVYRYTYTLQRAMVFLNFVKWPHNAEFNRPEKYGLSDTRNFYLYTDQEIRIGVWHILPASLSNQSRARTERSYSEALDNGEPVIVYMHGNSGSRAVGHRIELYKLLRDLNYHVIAFDYRSYADSSAISPTEIGVVDDSIFVYKWVAQRAKKAPIFVWGHSLGTGVSTHALDVLSNSSIQSHGLVLEAPFNNLRDEIIEHPFARFFRFLPWFEFFIVDPMSQNNLLFETDKHLSRINTPVLILHAHDDMVVPFVLGKRLYTGGLEQRRSNGGGEMKLVEFEKHLKFGHKFICRSPLLPGIVGDFVSKNIK